MRLRTALRLRDLRPWRPTGLLTVLVLVASLTAVAQASAGSLRLTGGLSEPALEPSTLPEVTNVAPATGPLAGGDTVGIGGRNLAAASEVDFGSTPASFNVKTSGRLEAIAPPGVEGTVDVTVKTPEGVSAISRSDHYSYVPAGPSVVEISPDEGSVEGGRPVKVLGAHFEEVSEVSFGGTPVAFTVASPEAISVTTPQGEAPTVDVRVTTPAGISSTSARDEYHYVDKFVEISKVSPNKGPTAGGGPVMILGEDFYGVTGVDFGNASSPSFTVNSPGSITAVAPEQTAEDATVTVLTNFGPSTLEYCQRNKKSRRPGKCAIRDNYKYKEPTVESVSPGSGPIAGGTSVALSGTGFALGGSETEVLFGKTRSTSVSCSSSMACTAVAPAAMKAGTAFLKVTVNAPGQRSNSKKNAAAKFVYE